MRARRVIKSIVISWDFITAVSATILTLLFRVQIPIPVGRDIAGFNVTLGALVFSVYFAALALVAATDDDEFLRFAAKEGAYAKLIGVFRTTLVLLFVTLLLSIGVYLYTLYQSYLQPQSMVPTWLVSLFAFTILYPLFASINAAFDAGKYAQRRALFLQTIQRDSSDEHDLSN